MIFCLSVISSFLASLSVILFLFGCMGYARDANMVKSTAWVRADEETMQGSINLYGFYYENSDEKIGASYQDNECVEGFCGRCADSGTITFALLVCASVLSLFTSAAAAYLSKNLGDALQILSLISCFAAVVCAAIGFHVFLSDCFATIDDWMLPNTNTNYGPGAILTLTGIILMALVVLCQGLVVLDNTFAVRARDFEHRPEIHVTVTEYGHLILTPNIEYLACHAPPSTHPPEIATIQDAPLDQPTNAELTAQPQPCDSQVDPCITMGIRSGTFGLSVTIILFGPTGSYTPEQRNRLDFLLSRAPLSPPDTPNFTHIKGIFFTEHEMNAMRIQLMNQFGNDLLKNIYYCFPRPLKYVTRHDLYGTGNTNDVRWEIARVLDEITQFKKAW